MLRRLARRDGRGEARRRGGAARLRSIRPGARRGAACRRPHPAATLHRGARRPEDERDRQDYQTVYAREEGAVAAPTAGLHFTPELLAALDARGVERRQVTLHVGAGTFLPFSRRHSDHVMHAERGVVSEETASAINAAGAGEGASSPSAPPRCAFSKARRETMVRSPPGRARRRSSSPGLSLSRRRLADDQFSSAALYAFHAGIAFSGLETMRSAYAHAISTGYRFYSYGDASLLFRQSS